MLFLVQVLLNFMISVSIKIYQNVLIYTEQYSTTLGLGITSSCIDYSIHSRHSLYQTCLRGKGTGI